MDMNRLTQKMREAMSAAQSLASRLMHQEVDTLHLLAEMLAQDNALTPRLLEAAGVSPDASAHAWLADKGYDPVYGARPLKRVIQKMVETPVARMLIASELLMGQTLHITVVDDALHFLAVDPAP